jgi:hypothetical protein
VEVSDVVGEIGTLEGLNEALAPAKLTLEVRLTDPVKPLRLVSVIVEVPDELDWTVIDVGFWDMLKSGGLPTVTIIVIE